MRSVRYEVLVAASNERSCLSRDLCCGVSCHPSRLYSALDRPPCRVVHLELHPPCVNFIIVRALFEGGVKFASQHLCTAHANWRPLHPLSYLLTVLDIKHAIHKDSDIGFPGEGDVWFSLRNTTFRNNIIVILEDIGGGNNALFCMTNYNACCNCDNNGGSTLGS